MQRRHQRGVSGNWAADRLTAEEEAEFKEIMRSFQEIEEGDDGGGRPFSLPLQNSTRQISTH